MNRKKLLFLTLLVLILAIVVIVVLALLGPAIGNPFSNIVSGLNTSGTSATSPDVTVTAPLAMQPSDTPQTTATTGASDVSFPSGTPEQTAIFEPSATSGFTTFDEATSTPYPMATEMPATAVPVEVAALPLKIVSVSGIVIGDGTLRVFAPSSVDYPQTTRVELELLFDNRYITPTPFGQITPIAVTQVTSTPRPGQPTPTERVAIHETSGLEIYQRMGASLICLPTSFDGCDTRPDPGNARIIPYKGVTWTWILSPKQDIKGPQDLHLELWTVERIDDGPEQADVVWSYDFKIKTNTSPDSNIVLLAIIGGVSLLVALVASGLLFARQRRQAPGGGHPRRKSTVFVSYRRTVSWSIARTIHDSLTARGADVFIDVDDINEGRFEEIIKHNIRDREYFVLVLAPGSLDSEWVIKEAAYALGLDKKIIPVLTNGFDLYARELPDALKGIKGHNAITLTPEFFNAAIDRLAQFVGLGGE